MFESIMNFFKNLRKTENKESKSKETAKERLHLVLMQDRANVSADFLEMMKQEIIEVIKKYIEVDEKEIDVRLTNGVKEDGTTEAPSLYANIPIRNIKNEMKKEIIKEEKPVKEKESSQQDNKSPEEDKAKEKDEEKNSDEPNETNKDENEDIKQEILEEENNNQEEENSNVKDEETNENDEENKDKDDNTEESNN